MDKLTLSFASIFYVSSCSQRYEARTENNIRLVIFFSSLLALFAFVDTSSRDVLSSTVLNVRNCREVSIRNIC